MKTQMKFAAVVIVLSVVIAIFLSGCALQKKKVYKVGVLSGLNHLAVLSDGIQRTMTKLGYIEGKNIIYDIQRTNFEPEKEKKIIEKFVNDKVDLIFTFPTEASMLTKQLTRDSGIPVVFSFANIEDTDLVDNILKPGGNITGVRYPGPDIAVKRLEVLLEIVPKAMTIMIPYNRNYPIVKSQLAVLYPAAAKRGIKIIELPATNAAELRSIFSKPEQITTGKIDAILFIPESLAITPEPFLEIAKYARKNSIPIGGALMIVGEYSTLFGVTVDTIKLGDQAAILADKILKGEPAGNIPVISAECFLEVNYKEARRMGIEIPSGLLSMANKIIK